ncbi:hypothetical protein NM208_g6333 [Fusarium decemcellulare]|uniref:Uncharacterized protein n=1 Tax=Fusarium decemcellulare TaxID=57161 RepID=A0ACC1SDJ2_9HYPO|nr:hypothetical protein NM208_g6333 [Fusarium decemcellulare]
MGAPHKKENSVFNHVAISVPDLEKAVEWYQEVFGFRRIRSDQTFNRDETPDSPYFRIYPPSMKKFKLAWLTSGNGVGIEIYEFITPKTTVPKLADKEEFEYARGGFFHIAITVADPDAVVKRCIETGGRQFGETVDVFGEKALNKLYTSSLIFETFYGATDVKPRLTYVANLNNGSVVRELNILRCPHAIEPRPFNKYVYGLPLFTIIWERKAVIVPSRFCSHLERIQISDDLSVNIVEC